jgi:cytochrome c biogenesis protein CcdA
MSEVSLPAAFAVGLLALLSPCSALLLPSFFAYAFATRTAQLLRTLAFYAGLLATLVPLGAGVSAASSIFYGHRALLVSVAGWAIIALGLVQVLGRSFAIPFAGRLQGLAQRPSAGSNRGWISIIVLGAVYGLAGFCSGPALGAILTMAATQKSPVGGSILLAVYALGMAAPLFVLAALWDRFHLARRRWLRGTMLSLGPLQVHSTSLVSGILFIGIGVLFLRFDGTAGITGMLGLGDTTDLEAGAQERVVSLLSGVPAWVVPAGITVVAALWALRRARETRPDKNDTDRG